MKSSSTNGLRWILALALLAGGARARAQSAPRSPVNSAPNPESSSASNSASESHAFRAGTGAQKQSLPPPQQTPSPQPAPGQEPSATAATAPPKIVEPL